MSKLWHRVNTYIKYDFREIVNPTSLPNSPDYVPPRKLTWGEILKVGPAHCTPSTLTVKVPQLLSKCVEQQPSAWQMFSYEIHLWSCTIQAIQGANRRYVDSWRASAEDEEELRRMTKAASETSLKDELCELCISA